MDINKDYYSILELDKNADEDSIKKNYRKLALKYHPDKNKGDTSLESKFKEINEANQILGNPNTKKQYDIKSKHGKNYQPGLGGFEFTFGSGSPFGGGGFDPFSIFNDLFRNRSEEFVEQLDIQVNLNISDKDSYLNTNKKITYNRNVHCEECDGTGFDKDSHSDECIRCDGRGKDRYGFKCESCNGLGKVFMGTCKKCNGEKVLSKETELNLENIFTISKNERTIRRGYGHQSKYYRNKVGSLIINIIYNENKKYQREGTDIRTKLDIHYEDAIKGKRIKYQHIDGKELLINVPSRTEDGETIRIKNRGFLRDGMHRGNLYIQLNVMIDYERVHNIQ